MAVSQLSLYNGALTILGERKLSSLTENRETQYKLTDIWDNDAVKRCLQMGQWNFAMRAVKLDSSPSVSPSFGYQYAFDKPTDYVRLAGLCTDEYYKNPLTGYVDEASWWFANQDPIYVRYVSNDASYGMDFSIWPGNFAEFVELYIAQKAAATITGLAVDMSLLDARVDRALKRAKGTDAMEEPVRFPQRGTWSRARQGSRGSGDRGNTGSLIG